MPQQRLSSVVWPEERVGLRVDWFIPSIGEPFSIASLRRDQNPSRALVVLDPPVTIGAPSDLILTTRIAQAVGAAIDGGATAVAVRLTARTAMVVWSQSPALRVGSTLSE